MGEKEEKEKEKKDDTGEGEDKSKSKVGTRWVRQTWDQLQTLI